MHQYWNVWRQNILLTTTPRCRFFFARTNHCMSKGRLKQNFILSSKLHLSDLFVVLMVEVIILHPPSSWWNCCARLLQTKMKNEITGCSSLSICLSFCLSVYCSLLDSLSLILIFVCLRYVYVYICLYCLFIIIFFSSRSQSLKNVCLYQHIAYEICFNLCVLVDSI